MLKDSCSTAAALWVETTVDVSFLGVHTSWFLNKRSQSTLTGSVFENIYFWCLFLTNASKRTLSWLCCILLTIDSTLLHWFRVEEVIKITLSPWSIYSRTLAVSAANRTKRYFGVLCVLYTVYCFVFHSAWLCQSVCDKWVQKTKLRFMSFKDPALFQMCMSTTLQVYWQTHVYDIMASLWVCSLR